MGAILNPMGAFVVEAKVFGEIRYIHLFGDFLEGISGVKSLYLSFKYQYWRDSPVFNLPKFPNLKYLKLNGDGGATWNLIHKVLESSSELEHLSIEKLNRRHWNEPEPVPTCMLMNLKTMEYDLIKARKCNINFLKFMLGNSKVLKKLTITCRARKSLKGNERFCATLSEPPRASRDCLQGCTSKTWKDAKGLGLYVVKARSGDLVTLGFNLPSVFKRKVENGQTTKFWTVSWLGGEPLCSTFPRLYRLERLKSYFVCERAPMDTTTCGNSSIEQPHPLGLLFPWAWSRAIRSPVVKQELQDVINLISNLYLSSENDTWECTLDDSRCSQSKA
ncbi:FBD-like protein [Tanacetum coccineum]